MYMLPVKPLFYSYEQNEQAIPELTKREVMLLEESKYLQIVERINLLALLCGYKWVTDVAIGLNHREEIEAILSNLELPFAYNHYFHEEKKYEWLQVAVNEPVLSYVTDRRDQLTVLEAGVLYGYPVSACLAYIGLLKKTGFDKTIAEYYLSGVFSATLVGKEREHFRRMWEEVLSHSDKIRLEAEREFTSLKSS